MKRTLFIGMLGLSALMSGYAQQGEGVRKGRIVREPLVHDPVMAKEGDTYYLYSTGHNVFVFLVERLIRMDYPARCFFGSSSVGCG